MANYDALRSGMEFKDYTELCEFLGEPIMEGNSKVSQLREWGDHFLWIKTKRKYTIKAVIKKAIVLDEDTLYVDNVIYKKIN